MAKPEWGRKRICASCNKKYYDLNKSPIICPSCGAEFDPEDFLRKKKGKTLPTKQASENDINLTDDISSIDDIEVDNDNEVVSDDDPLLEINSDDQNVIPEEEIDMDDSISYIEDNEITEDEDISDDNNINVEIMDDDKN